MNGGHYGPILASYGKWSSKVNIDMSLRNEVGVCRRRKGNKIHNSTFGTLQANYVTMPHCDFLGHTRT